MKTFVIEREVPGIGSQSPSGYCAIARTSNDALAALGVGIQWVESYVAADSTYCI